MSTPFSFNLASGTTMTEEIKEIEIKERIITQPQVCVSLPTAPKSTRTSQLYDTHVTLSVLGHCPDACSYRRQQERLASPNQPWWDA